MNRPVHLEIPADQPERAIAFYSQIFGWQFSKWEGPQPYWMIRTGEGVGIDGGLLPRMAPGQPVTATMEVADVEAMAEAVTAAGGKVVVPKMAIPGIGWLVYALDPEGNIFGMMQNDPAAA